jgi:hypothetical protein
MEHEKPAATEEQLEEHSLPGTNMAGKGPDDECEPRDEQEKSRDQGDGKTE